MIAWSDPASSVSLRLKNQLQIDITARDWILSAQKHKAWAVCRSSRRWEPSKTGTRGLLAAIFDFFTAIPEKRLPISLNFLYVLVARIKLDQLETDDVLDRAMDYRAVIATAAIEVMVELR